MASDALRLACASALGGVLVLCACQAPPIPSAPTEHPVVAQPAGAGAETIARYAVRAELSDIRFLVYRAGPLARLGHNHVIGARNFSGEIRVARDFRQSSFALDLPVADFVVDDAASRAEEGDDFAVQPDADAVVGTRNNMLGARVLDAAAFARLRVRSVGMTGPAWGPDMTVHIDLHGVERELTVPVALEMHDGALTATAAFEIRQTDFGIAPLSVLAGGLQVADRVKVRLHIVAQRAADPPH